MIQTEVQSVIPVQLVPVPGLPVPVPKGLRLYHVSVWVAAPVPVSPAHIRQSFDSLLGEEPALPLPQRPIQGKINVCDWVIARLESGSGKIVPHFVAHVGKIYNHKVFTKDTRFGTSK